MEKVGNLKMSEKKQAWPFEFVDVGELSTGIKINEGKYKGMMWEYGKVTLDEKSEELKLSFDYNIIENPNEIVVDEILYRLMGDILVEIISNDLDLNDN